MALVIFFYCLIHDLAFSILRTVISRFYRTKDYSRTFDITWILSFQQKDTFNQPYGSIGFSYFLREWQMSLSRFLSYSISARNKKREHIKTYCWLNFLENYCKTQNRFLLSEECLMTFSWTLKNFSMSEIK